MEVTGDSSAPAAGSDSPRPRLAIVVPALDEEPALAEHLPAACRVGDEVVVADGGSRDGTVRVAREAGAEVVLGAAGRGGQLNRGARATEAEVLLFLHADTRLPEGAREAILEAIDGGAVGGAFLLRFAEEERHRVLSIGRANVNFRTRRMKVPLGDQAQFVRREVFEAMGGFEDWPILEDLDFFRRLKARGRVAILPLHVTTSARRFLAQGPLRTVLGNWWIWLLFTLGVSPQRLARRYRNVR